MVKGMLSLGCSVFVIASVTSIAFAKQTFFNKVFIADRQRDGGSWRMPPERGWGLERPWQVLEQPAKRGGARQGGGISSYPFRIRLSEEGNMNSQQKRGVNLPGPGSLPVLEKGEERCYLLIFSLSCLLKYLLDCFFLRCNLMNLLHPVILNLPMITQVNKRESGQVREQINLT